jgi:hypothetical protein
LVLGGEVPLAAKQEMDETNSLKSGLGCKMFWSAVGIIFRFQIVNRGVSGEQLSN